MSMIRESASENSSFGRGLRKLINPFVSIVAKVASNIGGGSAVAGDRGHLGRQRALRLSALLAPRNRWKLGASVAVLVVAGAAGLSRVVFRVDEQALNNAIWLDRTWAYGDMDDARLSEFTGRLVENRIGKAYVYVSSLGIDSRWSGGPLGKGSFMDSRLTVAEFVQRFKSKHEKFELLAWVEIWTHLDNKDGYRLDDMNLHQNIADFCRLLVEQLGFDGVLLDVKPLFSPNDDLIRLIRRVRSNIGLESPVAVAVTADLTPPDSRLQEIASIAPGTMWSPEFKQRVVVSADEVVLLMYQSYRQEHLDYVNWVAHHVETYVNLLETDTDVVVSIPNYGNASSAHNPEIETMAAALDGVNEGLRRLDEAQRPLLTGVAIYSDRPLDNADWNAFRERWLMR